MTSAQVIEGLRNFTALIDGVNLLYTTVGVVVLGTMSRRFVPRVTMLASHLPLLLFFLLATLIYLSDSRLVPFTTAILTAIVYGILRLRNVEAHLAEATNQRFGPENLPRVRLSSCALVFGVSTYVLTLGVHVVIDAARETTLLAHKENILVAFTLPGESSVTTIDSQIAAPAVLNVDGLSERIWNYLRSTFEDIGKVEILPQADHQPNFSRLRSDFPTPHSRQRFLARNLAKHRKGTGSPVDFAIATGMTVLSVETPRIATVVRLYRLQHQVDPRRAKLNLTDWPILRLVSSRDDADLDRVALVAAAKLGMRFETTDAILSDADKSVLRTNLQEQFQSHCDETRFDFEESCPRNDIDTWVRSYTRRLLDKGAAQRFEREQNILLLRLQTMALDL